MYKIAIVEDDCECAERLKSHLARYRAEHSIELQIEEFRDGLFFAEDYKADYDIIFMDIEMPHLDGMKTARKIREVDQDVCLIFVTYMAQYALEGYEVRALDFIIKPVEYSNFSIKFDKAIEYRKKFQNRGMLINTREGMVRINAEDIYYIEVIDHDLVYHTNLGEFSRRGSISEEEKQLAGQDFARCNNSFLVNLNHVHAVRTAEIVVNGTVIPLGRTKKKEFIRRMIEFMGDYIQ